MQDLPTLEIACPLCGHDDSRFVVETRDFVYEVPGKTRFVKCFACQHIYINPRPTNQALMDCYPTEYEPHTSAEIQEGAAADSTPSATKRSAVRVWIGRIPFLKKFLVWLGQQHATIVPELPENGPRRLLEVGCADGRYLTTASAAGWQVDGIEPAESAAQKARQLGFEVQVTTLSQSAIGPGTREAVVAWMVLEHVPDPSEFLSSAHEILSPGGFLCVSVPNGGSFERRLFGKYWLGYDAPRHLQVFAAARLTRAMQDAGFQAVRVIHQSDMRYWWGSCAAWGMERFPNAKWPPRWMHYFINGLPRWMTLVSLVPEKLLSLFRMSGRITVCARKAT